MAIFFFQAILNEYFKLGSVKSRSCFTTFMRWYWVLPNILTILPAPPPARTSQTPNLISSAFEEVRIHAQMKQSPKTSSFPHWRSLQSLRSLYRWAFVVKRLHNFEARDWTGHSKHIRHTDFPFHRRWCYFFWSSSHDVHEHRCKHHLTYTGLHQTEAYPFHRNDRRWFYSYQWVDCPGRCDCAAIWLFDSKNDAESEKRGEM